MQAVELKYIPEWVPGAPVPEDLLLCCVCKNVVVDWSSNKVEKTCVCGDCRQSYPSKQLVPPTRSSQRKQFGHCVFCPICHEPTTLGELNSETHKSRCEKAHTCFDEVRPILRAMLMKDDFDKLVGVPLGGGLTVCPYPWCETNKHREEGDAEITPEHFRKVPCVFECGQMITECTREYHNIVCARTHQEYLLNKLREKEPEEHKRIMTELHDHE